MPLLAMCLRRKCTPASSREKGSFSLPARVRIWQAARLISACRTKANRANARASTGPKTDQGRAHSARNARRHGLSLPVLSNPALSEEVEPLARDIAGAGATQEILELASRLRKFGQGARRRPLCPFWSRFGCRTSSTLSGRPSACAGLRRCCCSRGCRGCLRILKRLAAEQLAENRHGAL